MANITERNGKYRIRISIYDNTGKQHFRSKTYSPKVGMTKKQIKKEVNRVAVLFEEEIKNSNFSFNIDKSFKSFMEEWFKTYAELTLKKITIGGYRERSKKLYEMLGDKKLEELNPLVIQKFVGDLTSEGLSPKSVKNYVRLVSNVLNYAVRKQVIPFNPCTTVDYPREVKKEKVMFSVEEVKKFLSLLNDESSSVEVFFILLIYTGARKSEILALAWEDIDFENGLISINKSYVYSSYYKESFEDTTKTVASTRVLKISKVPMDSLEKLKEWHNNLSINSKYIFVNRNGEILHASTPNHFLSRICKKHGFKKVNVHSFRHFAASAMISTGVDVVSVQSALGHSTPATTLNIYSHAFKNASEKASDAIVKVLE